MKNRRWLIFLRRLILASATAFVVAVAPLPVWTPDWFLYWQVPAVIFLFICYLGKLLIDTIVYPPEK
jgi:NADH:ubiquinone oxidoreductase subunit 2 (subunit N)